MNTRTKSGLSIVKRSARQISNARLKYRRLRIFLKNVLPDTAFSSRLKYSPTSTLKIFRFSGTQPEEEGAALPTPTITSISKEVVNETSTHRTFPELEIDDDEDDDDDDDDNFAEEDVQTFGRQNVGIIVSPYILPYFYNKSFLHTQYGIR